MPTLLTNVVNIKNPNLGAFVLSYSRKIMEKYFNLIDPVRLNPEKYEESMENMSFYGDTGNALRDIYLPQKKLTIISLNALLRFQEMSFDLNFLKKKKSNNQDSFFGTLF